jgi:gliding motility-associated-like protein
MLKHLILYIFLLTGSILHAQKQNNQWRFGNGGGIDFNTQPPSFVSGSSIIASEGSASVASADSGKLLFYTDGLTVWNRQNKVMPNGQGLLGGSVSLRSSTTAAVIVPKPLNNNQYYVVTIDEQFNGNGLRYSLVDMALNSGLGDVVSSQKNILLLNTNSEKLEVIPAANGKDFWIVTHDNPGNTFYSFLINASGFQTTPIVSSIGGNHGNGSGHLKASMDFKKLACGNLFDRTIELYDFNNSNGVISNAVIWKPKSTISPNFYGVEFSPNGKVLYISNLETILQYDISNGTGSAIAATEYQVTSNFNSYASMQLGPDMQLYINAGIIDVIRCPDQLGFDCGYQSVAFPGQIGGGGYGLPKWVFGFDNKMHVKGPDSIIFSDSCLASGTLFRLNDTTGVKSITWNFGDPISGSNNSTQGFAVKHVFTSANLYNIRAIITTRCGIDTVFLVKYKVVECDSTCLGSIKINSDSCLENGITFSVASSNTVKSVQWDFGDPISGAGNTSVLLNPVHVFSSAGVFKVRCVVVFDCGKDTLFRDINIAACDTGISNCEIFISNIFTPNDDSLNDTYAPVFSCTPKEYLFKIYNRWGQKLFESDNSKDSWNGKYQQIHCPEGVYFYTLTYLVSIGNRRNIAGTVNLIR